MTERKALDRIREALAKKTESGFEPAVVIVSPSVYTEFRLYDFPKHPEDAAMFGGIKNVTLLHQRLAILVSHDVQDFIFASEGE